MKKEPQLPTFNHKKVITTRLIKTSPSFLITLEYDKNHLRVIK